MIPNFEKHMPAKYERLAVFASMLMACAAGFALWAWWTSFDSPHIYPRPHPVMWDIVSMNLRSQGLPAAPGTHNIDENLLAHFAAWTMGNFGGDYRAIAAAQIPFLFLLLVSVGFIAWRLGGAFSGATAPWAALLGPMTIGLAVHFDDLLMLQACIAASMALLVWSDIKRIRWLSFLIAIPLTAGIKFSFYFSNGLFFLCFFACGAGSWLLWKWAEWIQKRLRPDISMTAKPAPWFQSAGVIIGIFGAWMAMRSIDYGSLFDSAVSERFTHLSVLYNPEAIWSGLMLWHWSMAGPTLSLLAIFAATAGLWGKKRRELIPLVGWLFLPILLLTSLPKRNDFYLITAIPATYVLISTGLAGIPRPKIKVITFVVAFALMGQSWFGWIQSEERGERVQELNPLFENIPFPYLISPMRLPRYDVSELGEILSAQCGARNAPVIFARGTPLDGWEAFYAWHENSNLPVGDINAERIPESENVCLVGLFNLGDTKPYTIKQLIERYEEKAQLKVRRNLNTRRRLEEIRKQADKYRLIHIYNFWGVFLGPGIKN